MLELGGSVATAAAGITAPVLVVDSFDDLQKHAAEARGKIVLFDVPFSTSRPPFEAYREAVAYRGGGATAAARVGALACLIRSIAPYSIQSPHTGGRRYDTAVARIPAAALSLEDAMMLHRMPDRGEPVVVTLKMSARFEPDAPSRNVVAEIVGSEKPGEVVVLGGHIDSWDVGQGAMDDGGGSVAAWEAVRLMKQLGLKPRRTIRVVLWTNEENGGRGGRAYRDAHAAAVDKHMLAIESDNASSSRRASGSSARTRGSPSPRTSRSSWSALARAPWSTARARPMSARCSRPACPACVSTSTDRGTSGIITRTATRWTSSIRTTSRSASPPWRSWRTWSPTCPT